MRLKWCGISEVTDSGYISDMWNCNHMILRERNIMVRLEVTLRKNLMETESSRKKWI